MVTLPAALVAAVLGSAGETVLLDFTATWCPPCQQLAPVIQALHARGYPVRQVDIDRERDLARRFKVEQVPTLVLLVDGREQNRLVGSASQADLERWLNEAGVKPGKARGTIPRGQSPDSRQPRRAGSADPRQAAAPARSWPADPEVADDETAADTGPVPPARRQAIPPYSPLAPRPSPLPDLLAASVRLRIQDPDGHSVGSGTIIDSREGEALVLTCGHVFRDSRGQGAITIDLCGAGAPQALPGELVSYNLETDVALVSFQPPVPVRVARVAPPGHTVRINDPVVNIGCNNGALPTARQSQVVAINKFLGPPNLQVAGQPEQGRSGGGLFSADGLVIGVCNAADPQDDQGLYAGLGSIHAELRQADILAMCLEPAATAGPDDGALVDVGQEPARLPALARSMPASAEDRSLSAARDDERALADRGAEDIEDDFSDPRGVQARPVGRRGLTAAETATLAEIQRRGEGAEVICIVRSLTDPRAKSEIIVLDRASPAFLEQLTSQRRAQPGNHLTSRRESEWSGSRR